MEPVLTQEELEAIYEAMQGDAAPQATVDDLPLTSRHEFISRAEKKWTETAKLMVLRLQSLLTSALGRRIKVEVQDAEGLEEEQTGDYQSLGAAEGWSPADDETAVVNVIKLGATRLLLGIDRSLAQSYIERRTGASSDMGSGAESQELTPLEQRLLRDLVNDLAQAAAQVSPHPCSGSADPQRPSELWQSRRQDEIWMMVRIKIIQLPGTNVWLCGPATSFLPKQDNARQKLVERLQTARIVLSAELGKFRMNVSDLWRLNPGSLVQLEAAVGDPLRVLVGGVPKLEGEPLVSRGNVAVRLVGRSKGVSK